jgi:hypothetical protein
MANFRTTADILDAVLRRCGETTDGNSDYESSALEYINRVYRSVLAGGNEFDIDIGEPWIWAQSSTPQVLQLKAPYETGTITLTNASTSGTFSSAPSISLAGWFIKPESGKDIYQISAHTASTTSFTLDQAYIEENVTDNFKAFKTDYALTTAVTRLVAPMVVYRDANSVMGDVERGQIYEIDLNTMLRKYPRMLIRASVPDKYCIISQGTTDLISVRFNSYPLEDCRVEIPYIAVASDLTDSGASVPLIPFGFREILIHGAAYFLMLDKSDDKAQTELALTQAKLKALVSHNRKSLSLAGGNFGKVIPRAIGRR